MNKKELRKFFLDKRKSLSDEELANKTLLISDVFFSNFKLASVKFLHIFLPITRMKEINTWVIIERIRKDFPHIKLVVPVSDFTSNSMKHVLFTETTILTETFPGIPEPQEPYELIEEDKMDMVIVPLAAVDLKGNRIGYGKGFYDRFLANCKSKTLKIGLSLELPVENIDADHFDVPIDYCVTSEEVFNFK